MPLDTATIRRDFPILERRFGGAPMVYLDSAATSLKPQPVIDAVVAYYTSFSANVRRGIHPLADEATEKFEEARSQVASFIKADSRDIAFVRNTTEGINVVARGLSADSKVLYGFGEHHSNFLPWRRMSLSETCPVNAIGGFDLQVLYDRLSKGDVDLLAVSHVSNALAAVNPVREITAVAHHHGCRVLVDASQSVPHQPIDVYELDCDFLCFSGHKMCGPSGIGVLYAKPEAWDSIEPLCYGGSMVSEVHSHEHFLSDTPWRFEAGTPFIEGAIGLSAACQYLDAVGMDVIHDHCRALVRVALDRLVSNKAVTIYGPTDAARRGASITFAIADLESHAVARWLATRHNIFVRSGFHCAQPAHESLHIRPTVRASFYLYNSFDEVERLADALQQVTQYCAS